MNDEIKKESRSHLNGWMLETNENGQFTAWLHWWRRMHDTWTHVLSEMRKHLYDHVKLLLYAPDPDRWIQANLKRLQRKFTRRWLCKFAARLKYDLNNQPLSYTEGVNGSRLPIPVKKFNLFTFPFQNNELKQWIQDIETVRMNNDATSQRKLFRLPALCWLRPWWHEPLPDGVSEQELEFVDDHFKAFKHRYNLVPTNNKENEEIWKIFSMRACVSWFEILYAIMDNNGEYRSEEDFKTKCQKHFIEQNNAYKSGQELCDNNTWVDYQDMTYVLGRNINNPYLLTQ